MNLPILKSVLRPITRVIVGFIAIPIFRFIMRKVFRLQDLDDELEKDLEEWFRGALLLLAATANMEHLLFGWTAKFDWMDRMDWLTMGLRLMLAIGVIEAMPDQELFAVIHPGPPKIKPGRSVLKEFWRKKWEFLKGFVCQHLNRSSPVLAMMAAIVGAQLISLTPAEDERIAVVSVHNWPIGQQIGAVSPVQGFIASELINSDPAGAQRCYEDVAEINFTARRRWERWIVGWCCYLLAITQYLIIGLVTSRDRALDVLSEFDRAVAVRRREIIEVGWPADNPGAIDIRGVDSRATHHSPKAATIRCHIVWADDLSRSREVDRVRPHNGLRRQKFCHRFTWPTSSQ